jgi:hypothetical protein
MYFGENWTSTKTLEQNTTVFVFLKAHACMLKHGLPQLLGVCVCHFCCVVEYLSTLYTGV